MSEKKRLPWRCRSPRQQKDKAEIYNSREWRELRIQKLRANPLCEMCIKEGEANGIKGGYIRAARCVHHIDPIETATTKEEMRRKAFVPLNQLMSLCYDCHAKIHKEMGSNTRRVVAERAEARQQRWKDSLLQRFTNINDNDTTDTTGTATVDAATED
ncbi:MAG: HNH endonuclease [Bacteroidaceae bacterium]|nr:HNH endonuclease [Bacteroidaceae bacterium]